MRLVWWALLCVLLSLTPVSRGFSPSSSRAWVRIDGLVRPSVFVIRVSTASQPDVESSSSSSNEGKGTKQKKVKNLKAIAVEQPPQTRSDGGSGEGGQVAAASATATPTTTVASAGDKNASQNKHAKKSYPPGKPRNYKVQIWPLLKPGEEEPDRRIWKTIVGPLRRSLVVKRFDIFARTLKHFAFAQEYVPPAHQTRKEAKDIHKRSATDFGNDPSVILADLGDMLGEKGVIDSLPSEHLSDLIWSLGKIGIKLEKPSEKNLVLRVFAVLIQRHNTTPLAAKEMTMLTGGMARLGIKFTQLEPQLQRDMLRVLGDVAPMINDREVSNQLHSLSKINVLWSDLPEHAKVGILESFCREAPKLYSQQGSMSLYALGLLGLNIDSVTPAVRDRIYVVALLVLQNDIKQARNGATFMLKRYAVQQISNAIYGLGKMGAKYETLPPNIRVALDNALPLLDSMNEQEVSNTVYSLGTMGADWATLSPDVQESLQTNVQRTVGHMISQGVSTTIYGAGLMAMDWASMSEGYKSAVLKAVAASFKDVRSATSLAGDQASPLRRDPSNPSGTQLVRPHGAGPQSLANIIYALGLQGAEWSTFPAEVQHALAQGMDMLCSELTTQEVSNTIYGFGLIKANVSELPATLIDAMARTVTRIVFHPEHTIYNPMPAEGADASDRPRRLVESSGKVAALNQQEVCSTLHGFAKMNTQWDALPSGMETAFIEMIYQIGEMGNVCLACTAYSLGLMGAQWNEFPPRLKEILVTSARDTLLLDQSMANVVYGLSLLGMKWPEMDSGMRDVLLVSLERDDCFNPEELQAGQHVCNTLWGLSKMDAVWDYLPKEPLMIALSRVADKTSCQETANAFYGLAMMDAIWSELPEYLHLSFDKAFTRNLDSMTIQEVANSLYSFALLTFDFPYEPYGPGNSKAMRLVWDLHSRFIDRYNSIARSEWTVENFDQFAIYFELLSAVPGGRDFAMRKLGSEIPMCSGPAGNVPSRLHAQCATALLESLNSQSRSGGFSIFNEFNGLGGVFPVDIGVYYKERLVAFVEIDGNFHYKFERSEKGEMREKNPTQLRRKDKLKEYCYRHSYPGKPLFRIRSDQCEELGFPRAGAALASWIIAHLKEKATKERE